MINKQPSYILIEGIDGAGKTTACNSLAEILQKRGNNVARMREPGGSPIAEQLRAIVLGTDYLKLTDDEDLTPLGEMFMMLAARSQSMAVVQRVIETPNTFVVADRGFPSTFAYQVSDEQTAKLYEDTWRLLAPENRLTVLLTCSYDVSCERRKQRCGYGDRIEQRLTEENFEQTKQRYLSVPGGYDLVIDTDELSVSDVIRQILGHIFP
ncbi:putative dTMP kinase [Erwinia phage vB_EamM_Yoloswag]|uniref:dTMP kinase n=1 Tax=Erwinia phage vB_EamM_Yoloswag TaxID=1958956 RepID=A0A1S6L347_9CAUD|nr:thymidylate kinase [Erwinia phage vB_EamM_Yoloswag]AQT28596.1 putative dTMP kinase [Erwinia phage vB_EamM_Yoloswag]